MANHPPSIVFLLGVPRSGTTLLSCLLNQHPDIYCPPEPWLLLGLEALGKVPIDHPADSSLLTGATTEFLGSQRSQYLKQAARAIYEKKRIEVGKQVFIDKTPRYYHIPEFLSSFLPENKFILLVRNPLDIAASFKTSWGVNLPQIISQQDDTPFLFDYILGINRLLVFSKSYPVLGIAYENLVTNPDSEINRIFDYLSLPKQKIDQNLDPSIYKESLFGDRNILDTPHIHTQSIGTYQDVFTSDEIGILINGLGKDTYIQLGYGEQCDQICEKFNISLDPQQPSKLFEVAENYIQKRRISWSDPKHRGVFGTQIEGLTQQLEALDIHIETVETRNTQISQQLQDKNKELDFLKSQLVQIQKEQKNQLEHAQKEKEKFNHQLKLIEYRGLRTRLREDLIYIKIRIKDLIKRKLFQIAQGSPLPPLPKISIVTPVLNGEQYLTATLSSVLSQNYPYLEFIIVDGGSTDSTLSIIKDFQQNKNFPNEINKVISEPDQGMYDAITKGFSCATGEILAYINGDDLLEGGAFTAVGSYFASHLKATVIYHEDCVLVNGWKYPNIYQPKGINTAQLLNRHILFQDGVFFRRSAYEKVGGIRKDLKYAGDYDLWLRLSAKFTFIRQPNHVSTFRVHQGQLSQDMESYRQEMDQTRNDFLHQASSLQKLYWEFQAKYYCLFQWIARRVLRKNRLFFPIDFRNQPPPVVTLIGTEYGQAISPIDDKPAERLLFSTPDTRFGGDKIHHIYLDTRHNIAITYPLILETELDALYQQHYSSPPIGIQEPKGTSPYRQFNGKCWWEKILLRLPIEKVYPYIWQDQTLAELIQVLRSIKIDIKAPLKLLDVGCFEGQLLDEIKTKTPWQGSGLEANPKAVEIASKKGHLVWQGHGSQATEIIPKPHQFDVIFMGQTIEHMNNPIQVLRQLRLLLAPSGVLILSTPNLDSRQINWFGPTWAHWHAPYHRYIFSKKGLYALAKQVGLKSVCFNTFSHPYWSALSIIQNSLGLGGSVSHGIEFAPLVSQRAARVYFWQRLFWNRLSKGDYSFFAMQEGEG
ncbi:sulfotransferase [Candidatus Nitrosacidococcus sp. I8]|uniref:sulfotransferase n=1 Tax=Candidatus Nitrosacidococcus sp. I8 TaxID=2942908 RepID=UPI002225BA53|nr:sulfotransferase [Candidatus Nitrosacidococcus sp. I8]CAH9017717.1 Ubiquinone biosynthesis O-methyltransferase, mitochondrial [Candidatus Nitrosacidococcus sp. I8]